MVFEREGRTVALTGISGSRTFVLSESPQPGKLEWLREIERSRGLERVDHDVRP